MTEVNATPASSAEFSWDAALDEGFRAGYFGRVESMVADTLRRAEPGAAVGGYTAVLAVAAMAAAGHSCVDLGRADELVQGLAAAASDDSAPPPSVGVSPEQWASELAADPLVDVLGADGTLPPTASDSRPDAEIRRPLVLDGARVWLQRWWSAEVRVARQLQERLSQPSRAGGSDDWVGLDPRQAAAATRAMTDSLTIVTGGPGTGKTTTIAAVIDAELRRCRAAGTRVSIALAAPTGKAAARMSEAISSRLGVADLDTHEADQLRATTLHRLLGPAAWGRVERVRPVAADLVVVDEMSMVPLPLMVTLMESVAPTARLLLVGDPDQLHSVELGAVLGDLIQAAEAGAPIDRAVVRLSTAHRFQEADEIAALGEAVRSGDADRAVELLRVGDSVRLVDPADASALAECTAEVIAAAVQTVRAARRGTAEAAWAAAHDCKVLAATRRGPLGVTGWTERVEAGIVAALGPLRRLHGFYDGQPIVITRNDAALGVSNGDVGISIDGEFVRADGPPLRTTQLTEFQTWWAMTVHRAQGSEFPRVVVSLSDADSLTTTRQLLYTAVTRAKQRLVIVGTEATVRAAVERPVVRMSCLADRLGTTEN
jgi:exodeoxyribonuclease V alpha subunit